MSTVTQPVAPASKSAEPLLTLRGVNKSFGAVQVLHDVDFDVYPGEVTALVGDNGAGKSTLIKGVAGIYPFDSGEMVFDGKVELMTSPKHASALGIEVVYQDLALCDNLDVVHNMFLGREMKSRSVLDEVAMEGRASETLAGLSVRTLNSVRQPVASVRPLPSPRPCSGTASWSSSTSRRRRSGSPRPSRSSTWYAAWPTAASGSCSSRTT